ncbi:LCP family protein [Paenibacillus aestuarii]|uniref:LCP family protein n=1 Tax=Paenibacillus aestuarii TaxID=516965 RepID=A0ABW0K1A3_9BACL|nr:LCP family protein [Paenibacillus aestuarii]
MKRWTLYTAASILVGLFGTGSYLYYKYEPNHYFKRLEVPVLSTPSVAIQPSPLPMSPGTQDTNIQVTPDATPKETSTQDKDIKAFNVLILGLDARKEESSRSDVIMVMHVIPSAHKVNLISIPRDTRVNIEGVGYTKINHAHILGELKGGNEEGTKEAIQAVSNFLQVPMNYYVKTNFAGFENIIDAVGGVDVELEHNITLPDIDTTLSQGKQHINGKIALSLARERYSMPNGDFDRQAEQSQILKNVALKLLQPEHIGEIAALLPKVKKDIQDTNFQDNDLISLAWLFKGMTEDDFTYRQIPGASGYELDPLMQMRLYYWLPDMTAVKELRENFLEEKSS